jgi:hypothetical protein
VRERFARCCNQEHPMPKIADLAAAALAVAAVTFVAGNALAQSTGTFVSGHGTDSGACTVSAPCRTFAFAITQTASGGEITVLDSAGYGPVTITQSVTITSPGGVEAGITAPSGQPAIVVTGVSNVKVTLRGLSLLGVGAASDGIVYNNGGRIEIVDCTINGFTHDGIYMPVGASGNGNTTNTIFISNTTASNNGSSGIEIAPSTDFDVRGAIDGVAVNANGASGILINGTNSTNFGFIDIAISNAIADSNGGDGFTVEGIGNLKVEIKNSTGSNNLNNGLDVSGAIVGISANSFVVNSTGFTVTNSGMITTTNSGTITTFSNNVVDGNRGGNVGSLTASSLQ